MLFKRSYAEPFSSFGFMKRISWAAVFAGVATVLACELVLGLIGLSVGTGSIDPLSEQNPMSGLGVGTIIWLVITTFLSLFAGGWVAGRLAGIPDKTDSMIHGFLSWGLASFATFYLLSTTIGGILKGATGLLGNTVSLLGRGMGAVTSEVAKQGASLLGGVDLSDIKNEANSLLRDTEKRNLQPNQLNRLTQRSARDLNQSATEALKNPQAAGQDLSAALDRLFNRTEGTLSDADKDAVVNVLVNRTNMTRLEASQTVDRWITVFNDAKAKVQQAGAQAEQKAREAGDAVARATSKAAAWTAVLLILGAIAACCGGIVSAPEFAVSKTTASGTIVTSQDLEATGS